MYLHKTFTTYLLPNISYYDVSYNNNQVSMYNSGIRSKVSSVTPITTFLSCCTFSGVFYPLLYTNKASEIIAASIVVWMIRFLRFSVKVSLLAIPLCI